MDLSDKIWIFTFQNRSPEAITKFHGVVIADSEAQAEEIVRTLMVKSIENVTIKKANTYPLVITCGYKAFVNETAAGVPGSVLEIMEVE